MQKYTYSIKITADKTFGGYCIVLENGTKHSIYRRIVYINMFIIAYIELIH